MKPPEVKKGLPGKLRCSLLTHPCTLDDLLKFNDIIIINNNNNICLKSNIQTSSVDYAPI